MEFDRIQSSNNENDRQDESIDVQIELTKQNIIDLEANKRDLDIEQNTAVAQIRGLESRIKEIEALHKITAEKLEFYKNKINQPNLKIQQREG